MRIAVMGAGGVGGCLGALLARASNDVSLLARGPHLDAIKAQGFRLRRGGDEVVVRPAATDDPTQVGTVNLVLFTVKTHHSDQAVPALRPLVGPDTAVLTLQNGVESHLQLSEFLGPGHVLPGAYWSASSVKSPGVVTCVAESPSLSFGEEGGEITERAEAIRDVFQKAGINAELSPDPLQVIWNKFVVLCSIAGITSAAQTRIGEFIREPRGLDLFTAAMREIDSLGRKKGVNLPERLVDQSVEFTKGYPDFQNSMHADFEAGRPTELEALNGAVVRMGVEEGVPTPVNQFIYAVLTPLKGGQRS